MTGSGSNQPERTDVLEARTSLSRSKRKSSQRQTFSLIIGRHGEIKTHLRFVPQYRPCHLAVPRTLKPPATGHARRPYA
jgi:hypothetical protein